MRAFALAHRSDGSLLRHLSALVAQDRRLTASVLAHLAEVDARRLYLPRGYPPMFAYCVEELHFPEDAAYKRIQAGRAARQFPLLFRALAEGRLHLAAICLLAPHLTSENAEELVAACTHRPKAEIERWLGDRFPPPELSLSAAPAPQLAPGQVEDKGVSEDPGADPDPAQLVPTQLAPGQVGVLPEPVSPASPRLALRVVLDHEKLQYARELLSHSLPSGEVSQVLD